MRLQLARALMCPADLMLLDEPTNHLDLDALVWLEAWLQRYSGTMIVISHDREFLDAVTKVTVHLDETKLVRYTGNYTAFEEMRSIRLEQAQQSFEKQKERMAHLQKFIDRFKAKASKAKQAQSRVKRLAKLAGTEAVRAERAFRINFAEPARLPHSLIRLNHVDAGYRSPGVGLAAPTTTKILHNVGFGLEAGDRVGLLGPNGAGKSTLVKTLVGELPLLDGERSAHKDLKIGYFAQHTVESLHEGQTALWHLKEIAPEAGEQVLRNFLGLWNFAGERAFESVDSFSGGERARLALALIAYSKPNVLLLDEPTNHLDLDMREALAEALSDFDGAIVLVSHDRHLIGMVCETFWRVADGRVEAFDGDLDEYAAWLRSRGNKPAEKSPPIATVVAAAAKPKPARSKQAMDAAAKRIKQLETQIAAIQSEARHIEGELADPTIYGSDGGGAVVRLAQRQGELQKDREALEAEWLELYEQQETA
jgi:ATP-binding cassette subfamily F protein 3